MVFISFQGIPTTLRYKGVVENLIEAIDRSRMEDFVREFSSFYNRYYDGIFGLRSQQWLLQQIQDSLQGYSGIATVQEFKHPWLQSSIIARFEGSDSTLKSELVILGAHQDSINLQGAFLSAPGTYVTICWSSLIFWTNKGKINIFFQVRMITPLVVSWYLKHFAFWFPRALSPKEQ